jgi:hypothetical protein
MQTSQAEAMAGVCAAAEAQERVLQQQSAATDAVARAAQESAEIARRALTELERPFAFVEVTQSGIGPGPLCRFTISLTGEQFRFRVVNHGRTPAFLIDRLTFWPIEAGMTARPYPIKRSRAIHFLLAVPLVETLHMRRSSISSRFAMLSGYLRRRIGTRTACSSSDIFATRTYFAIDV